MKCIMKNQDNDGTEEIGLVTPTHFPAAIWKYG